MNDLLEGFFDLKEKGTNIKTEVIAGMTTFVTMVYILAVNPLILQDAGMDPGAVFTATCLATIISTICMAIFSNYPFVLSAGMGINAYFAYVIVGKMGMDFRFALCAVFLEGIIFILLTFVKAREAIVNSIPASLKSAVAVGIGLFIGFIGLQQAGIIVLDEVTLVTLGDLRSPGAIVCIVGLITTALLLIKNIPGALLIGVLISTLVGIPLGVTQTPQAIVSAPPSLKPTFLAFRSVSLQQIFSVSMMTAVITLLFVDLFDTIGMLVGTASKADMLDENGELPRATGALFADAVGTTIGAILGTSTITTFAESTAGISEGGRTGLTGIVASLLFLMAMFFSPIFLAIPGAATASALLYVGLFMLANITKIGFDDYTESIPAYLTMILMPLTYSIGNGLMFGIISYAICKLISGRYKECSVVVYILATLFVLKIIFLGV
ncbi:MAG: NCS2 family permease [Tissierellia bacterium]|nr:NCS2 family permease [Tissierellia bacterium]